MNHALLGNHSPVKGPKGQYQIETQLRQWYILKTFTECTGIQDRDSSRVRHYICESWICGLTCRSRVWNSGEGSWVEHPRGMRSSEVPTICFQESKSDSGQKDKQVKRQVVEHCSAFCQEDQRPETWIASEKVVSWWRNWRHKEIKVSKEHVYTQRHEAWLPPQGSWWTGGEMMGTLVFIYSLADYCWWTPGKK